MLRAKLGLALVGAVLLFIGWQEFRLASVAKPTASDISLAELAQKGPGENAHLNIRDFVLCNWAYVVSEKKGQWNVAWVPALARDDAWFRQEILGRLDENGAWPEGVELPRPPSVKVVFKLTEARDERDVSAIAAADTVAGMVLNEIQSLDDAERDLLQQNYPGVDFGSVTIFQPGRSPSGLWALVAIFVGGLTSLAVSLYLFLRGARSKDAVS